MQYAINAEPIWRRRVTLMRIQKACVSGKRRLTLPLMGGDDIPLYLQLLHELETLFLDYLSWPKVIAGEGYHDLKKLERLNHLPDVVRAHVLQALRDEHVYKRRNESSRPWFYTGDRLPIALL